LLFKEKQFHLPSLDKLSQADLFTALDDFFQDYGKEIVLLGYNLQISIEACKKSGRREEY